MVVKNTHTPAAAAMQGCVTHGTCVADFVLYTSAPDRGGRKICRWPWCMCAQAKHFPHALFIDQPLSPWMSWPRWKRLLNKDSYSWFCFCGWLHLSFWSPLYQQAFTSALILQPQFVDRCRIKWFLLRYIWQKQICFCLCELWTALTLPVMRWQCVRVLDV